MKRVFSRACVALLALIVFQCSAVLAAAPPGVREFRPGALRRVDELPDGRFRRRLESLSPNARSRALEHLKAFHFTEQDLESLDADAAGDVFYADTFAVDPVANGAETSTGTAEAAVPVQPLAPGLVFHSRRGSSNVLYLNFTGENVTGTAWNTSLGRTTIAARPFSTDADFTTFSSAEQLAIKRIWERVAEDYAPFDVDVTTERPAVFTARTAHAVITRSVDANGLANPSSSAGGVAYISVFGNATFATYQPAWIYSDNLSGSESYIAEATSHELGHNLGLSHDGTTAGADYYGGHGSGNTSWGPIMGTGYGRSVSQWSKGEYYLANNTQDDLATIAARIPYRADDHGDTPATATPLVLNGSNIVSTTPDTDPGNEVRANKGVIERRSDVDVFSFATGSGLVSLNVNPWIQPSGTRGGNLDLLVELRDASGVLIASANPVADTVAELQVSLAAGTYYLHVRNTGVGTPLTAAPSGYTSYGSLGQYFISGSVAPPASTPPTVQLTASANNPAWGTVSPATATFAPGTSVQLLATPAPYFRFLMWSNAASGVANPLSLVLQTNTAVQAVFGEIMTTNHPTPYWWLAANGVVTNFETAVDAIGANGLPLWQSYIAGVNPAVASSGVRLRLNGNVLRWTPVAGRTYSLLWSTNVAGPFTTVPGATNLPATVSAWTNSSAGLLPQVFYRLQVRTL